jgi:hypothetical protein
MNRYETSRPRASFGIAAMAITAIVVALTVVLPASMTSAGGELRSVAKAGGSAQVATEVDIIPATITVTGIREQNTAFDPARRALPKG